MSLIEKIKQDQVAARINRNSLAANLLTTLIGEAEMVGKNAGNRASTDAEVVAVIKKFIKNAEETLDALVKANRYDEVVAQEINILKNYLPQQLDTATLEMIAKNCRDLPDFMRYLKQEYAGRYDGKLASTVAREVYA